MKKETFKFTFKYFSHTSCGALIAMFCSLCWETGKKVHISACRNRLCRWTVTGQWQIWTRHFIVKTVKYIFLLSISFMNFWSTAALWNIITFNLGKVSFKNKKKVFVFLKIRKRIVNYSQLDTNFTKSYICWPDSHFLSCPLKTADTTQDNSDVVQTPRNNLKILI